MSMRGLASGRTDRHGNTSPVRGASDDGSLRLVGHVCGALEARAGSIDPHR
jgi:hypothetical protein